MILLQNGSKEGGLVQNYLHATAEWQVGRLNSSKLSSYNSRMAGRKAKYM